MRENSWCQRLRSHEVRRLGGGLEPNVANLDFIESWAHDLAERVRQIIEILQRFLEKLLAWGTDQELVY